MHATPGFLLVVLIVGAAVLVNAEFMQFPAPAGTASSGIAATCRVPNGGYLAFITATTLALTSSPATNASSVLAVTAIPYVGGGVMGPERIFFCFVHADTLHLASSMSRVYRYHTPRHPTNPNSWDPQVVDLSAQIPHAGMGGASVLLDSGPAGDSVFLTSLRTVLQFRLPDFQYAQTITVAGPEDDTWYVYVSTDPQLNGGGNTNPVFATPRVFVLTTNFSESLVTELVPTTPGTVITTATPLVAGASVQIFGSSPAFTVTAFTDRVSGSPRLAVLLSVSVVTLDPRATGDDARVTGFGWVGKLTFGAYSLSELGCFANPTNEGSYGYALSDLYTSPSTVTYQWRGYDMNGNGGPTAFNLSSDASRDARGVPWMPAPTHPLESNPHSCVVDPIAGTVYVAGTFVSATNASAQTDGWVVASLPMPPPPLPPVDDGGGSSVALILAVALGTAALLLLGLACVYRGSTGAAGNAAALSSPSINPSAAASSSAVVKSEYTQM